MNNFPTLMVGLFCWSVVGALFFFPIMSFYCSNGAVGKAEGIEFVNPAFVHKHNKVNWFGAFIVATLYGLISPFATMGYWIYKLCTVGRR